MSDPKNGIKISRSGDVKFDLREILDAIGVERINACSWKVKLINLVIPDDNPFYESIDQDVRGVRNGPFDPVRPKSWTSGKLLQFADSSKQVVDGAFVGYSSTPKGKKRRLVIKAFDSAFWEVWADRQAVIDDVTVVFPWSVKILTSVT